MTDKISKNIPFQKRDDEERIVGGIVYAPNQVDSQGDWTDEVELKKAMYQFMEASQGFNEMHVTQDKRVSVLECFQPEEDTVKGGGVIPAGAWWVSLRVHDDDLWEKVKSEEYTGFSLQGSGTRIKDYAPQDS